MRQDRRRGFNFNLLLQAITIIVLIYGLVRLEDQLLIWLDDIEQRVKSIETHLIKTDPAYVQTE